MVTLTSISKGADVNAISLVKDKMDALMFTAIKNHTDVVRLLLDHGADPERVNTTDRQAIHLAGYVDSDNAVDVILGYFPKSELEYFTHGSEPMLPKGECCDEPSGMHRCYLRMSTRLSRHWMLS